MAELKDLTVQGLTYEEILPEVIKDVAYLVNLLRDKYPRIVAHNIKAEDLVGDILLRLCSGNSKNPGQNNLEYIFRYTAENELPKKYLMSYVNVITQKHLMTVSRNLLCKKRFIIPISSDSLKEEYGDIFEPIDNQVILNDLIIKDIINSVPDDKSKEYELLIEDKREPLTKRRVVELLLSGMKKSEINKLIVPKRRKRSIATKLASAYVAESVKCAQIYYLE